MRNVLLNIQIALDVIARIIGMLLGAMFQIAMIGIVLCLIGGAVFFAFWSPKMFFVLLPFAALLVGVSIHYLNKKYEERTAASLKSVEEAFARAQEEVGTADGTEQKSQTHAPAGVRGDDRFR